VPIDVDDDCDDDLVVLAPGVAPAVWLQDADGAFTAGALPALEPSVAVAGADLDGDGATDLAFGATGLHILRNDGNGVFTEDGGAVQGGAANDVTALAFGDLSGDGLPELIVGRGGAAPAPAQLYVDNGGSLVFSAAPLPAVPFQTRGLAIADTDADGFRDVVLAALGSRVHLYVNRGGLLEDRSIPLLPSASVVNAAGLSVADFDGDCRPDIAVGLQSSAAMFLWRGTDSGRFSELPLPPVTDSFPVIADVDGDGAGDLVVGGTGGVTWIGR